MSTLLPHMSDFSATEFMNFSKTSTSTVLELGAVDEGQLFQLSDAEWGQVMGEFGDELNGMNNGELQWEGGVRNAFGNVQ